VSTVSQLTQSITLHALDDQIAEKMGSMADTLKVHPTRMTPLEVDGVSVSPSDAPDPGGGGEAAKGDNGDKKSLQASSWLSQIEAHQSKPTKAQINTKRPNLHRFLGASLMQTGYMDESNKTKSPIYQAVEL